MPVRGCVGEETVELPDEAAEVVVRNPHRSASRPAPVNQPTSQPVNQQLRSAIRAFPPVVYSPFKLEICPPTPYLVARTTLYLHTLPLARLYPDIPSNALKHHCSSLVSIPMLPARSGRSQCLLRLPLERRLSRPWS